MIGVSFCCRCPNNVVDVVAGVMFDVLDVVADMMYDVFGAVADMKYNMCVVFFQV